MYTCMHMCRGTPEKCGGNRILLYTLHLSSIELYVMQNHHYGNTTGRYGNFSACACSVYQAPSPLRLEGLGMRLGLVLQVAQWYYSSGVPSLYLLVFYHCMHNKVDGHLEHLPPPLHVHLCITIYSCQTDPVYQQTASSPRSVPLILLAGVFH